MAVVPVPLAQARPAGTSAVSAYTPAAGTVGVIHHVTIANTTASPADYKLYLDIDGSTFDSDSLVADGQVAANDDLQLTDLYWPLDSSGDFAIEQGTGSALNFTISGIEVT